MSGSCIRCETGRVPSIWMETTAGVTCDATAAKAFCVSIKGAIAAVLIVAG